MVFEESNEEEKLCAKFTKFCTGHELHPCRRKPVRRVTRPQLPVAVVAPAVDAAAAQPGTRVIVSRSEGHDSWVRREWEHGMF